MRKVRCVLFFNDTSTTGIYTLSLHDALPILPQAYVGERNIYARDSKKVVGIRVSTQIKANEPLLWSDLATLSQDRKSTRLNSSHSQISYAVFCLKKKRLPWRP